jgi:hypothetical protein
MTNHARRPFRISGIDRPDAEQAFDAADNAADGTADHGSDRPRGIHADRTAMHDAVGNALRPRRKRQGKCCGDGGDRGTEPKMILHATPFPFVRRRNVAGQSRRLRGSGAAMRRTSSN